MKLLLSITLLLVSLSAYAACTVTFPTYEINGKLIQCECITCGKVTECTCY